MIGYRSLKVAGIDAATAAGARLGLFGFGASASIMIQVAVAWGCEVYVCTRSEREQSVALEPRSDWAGGFDEQPPQFHSTLRSPPPRSGSDNQRALRALDRGGVVAVNAIHLDEVPAFAYD